MDAAVDFYNKVLGMKLTNRFGNHWATVEAGRGLTIGLHPASPMYPAPGTKGGILLGIEIDEPLDSVVERLQRKGVRFTGPIVKDGSGNFASFEDPDGNPCYPWEVTQCAKAESNREHAAADSVAS